VLTAPDSVLRLIPVEGGSLGDRFGRKRFFAAGLVVFALGSVACALSASAPELIAARAIQGVGAPSCRRWRCPS
jgi:MFS family permease